MFLKLRKIHVKTSLLESLLTTLQVSMCETSLKRDPAQVFSYEFSAIFQNTLFTEHLRMAAPADSLIPTKVLSIDHTLFVFHSFFFFFMINCNHGSLLRTCLTFFYSYSKISIVVVKTIATRQ